MRPRPLASAGLPAYAWDRASLRYRSRETGRYVARRNIVELLRGVTDSAAERMANVARLAARGEISPAVFERAMQTELKHVANAATALANGGWDRLTPAHHGRTGAALRVQYQFLRGFVADIQAGALTEANAAARAQLYAGAAYNRYWVEERRGMLATGRREARWVDRRDRRECEDCARLGRLGWLPLEQMPTTPGAGATACLGHCRCSLIYR